MMTEPQAGSPSSIRTTGWLSIIAGPGTGTSLALGYGANSMGRALSERVPLNFGDNQISRQGHAVVTYDPRGKMFYLQSGGGQNLTYMNEQLVLIPTVLNAGDRIQIGETTLFFTPLCGPDFDWQAILNGNDASRDKSV
ncbi:FHA domain-containing protein [Gammaproteobacteria bacterium LSUCC0112]|nr:FHA domain-containing protein [Gammaproteobacteria bacterium LSUCC0112]